MNACSSEQTPTDGEDAAHVTLTVSLSKQIQTVGIAQWSITDADDTLFERLKADSAQAHVRYGIDAEDLRWKAPVDLSVRSDQETVRTLLLGLEPATAYFAQVVLTTKGQRLESDVVEFTSGDLPNGGPSVERSAHEPGASEGFTIACSAGAVDPNAFIFDQHGNIVWLYSLAGTNITSCSRARMSYDGAYVWVGSLGDGLLRISLDGSEQRAYTLPFRHHDFAVLPNGHLVYFARASKDLGPDTIYEFDPETETSTPLYDQSAAFSFAGERGTHTNYITFVPELQALSFSMRETNSIAVISYPEGELLTVFGGETSHFEGMSWSIQHGHVVTPDSLVVFNNEGKLANAAILEYKYSLADHSWQETFRFDASYASIVLGDVVRLPSYNLLVGYSAAGVIQELDATGTVVSEFHTDPVGYFEHRQSLYGPPPPFDRVRM